MVQSTRISLQYPLNIYGRHARRDSPEVVVDHGLLHYQCLHEVEWTQVHDPKLLLSLSLGDREHLKQAKTPPKEAIGLENAVRCVLWCTITVLCYFKAELTLIISFQIHNSPWRLLQARSEGCLQPGSSFPNFFLHPRLSFLTWFLVTFFDTPSCTSHPSHSFRAI